MAVYWFLWKSAEMPSKKKKKKQQKKQKKKQKKQKKKWGPSHVAVKSSSRGINIPT